MSTAFKQVKNNAKSLVATAPSPASSGTSLVVTAADGAKFPAPGNGFWATIWNKTTYADPGDDPNMEVVLVTARSTDTFTITRGQLGGSAGRTVTTADTIALLDVDQLFIDMATAINTLEAVTVPKPAFDAVVATSGGDYTTVGAAIAASKYNLYIKAGTYTEVAATLNAVSHTVHLFGEDRNNTIIQLAAGDGLTGRLVLSGTAYTVRNLTIKAPAANLTNLYDGWVDSGGNDAYFENVRFLGQNGSNTGHTVKVSAGTNIRFQNCEFINASGTNTGSGSLHLRSADGIVISNCYFSQTQPGALINFFKGQSGTINDVRIEGCDFRHNDTGSSSACINGASQGGAFPTKVSIINNHFYSTQTGGSNMISFNYNTNGNVFYDISHNIIDAQGTTGGYAMQIGGDEIVIEGNIINRIGTSANPTLFMNTSNRYTIRNNHFYNSAASTTGMEGIDCSGGTAGVIEGNFVYGYQGTSSIGIKVGDSRVRCLNNNVETCTTGISDATANNNFYYGNTFASNTTNYSITQGNFGVDSGYINKTTTYSAATNDGVIICDTTSAAFTVTLPTAVGIAGKRFTIKDKGSGATNNVTIATTSSQTIDGSTTKVINVNYGSITVVSNNANWFSI